jgi:hypothetical protein
MFLEISLSLTTVGYCMGCSETTQSGICGVQRPSCIHTPVLTYIVRIRLFDRRCFLRYRESDKVRSDYRWVNLNVVRIHIPIFPRCGVTMSHRRPFNHSVDGVWSVFDRSSSNRWLKLGVMSKIDYAGITVIGETAWCMLSVIAIESQIINNTMLSHSGDMCLREIKAY